MIVFYYSLSTRTSIIIVTLWVHVFRFFPGRNLSERKLRLEKSRRRYDYYGDTKITGCALRPSRPRLVSTGCRYTPPTPHPSPVTIWFPTTFSARHGLGPGSKPTIDIVTGNNPLKCAGPATRLLHTANSPPLTRSTD